jgi:UDP-N-acetylglucosamine 1-carboxyvinyltransferase
LERIIITGDVPLQGEVCVSGSKNAALAIMAGAVLASEPVILHNLPRITDIYTMMAMLRRLGTVVEFIHPRSLLIDASHISHLEAPHNLVTRMRASFSVTGPLVARFGFAKVPLPGGCDIGARPVDFHIKGLRLLGARVEMDGDFVTAEAARLRGNTIYLDYPSAGATQHLMTAAVLAEGTTVIENAAEEPEVVDLANFLITLGARIEGHGTRRITIEGVSRLRGGEYTIIPDRLEAGTYAIAAAMTRGKVRIVNANADHMMPVLLKLQEAGVQIETDEAGVRVQLQTPPKAVNIKTMPHPGFPTDMQQPMTALLCVAEGVSIVTETVYERRFRYVQELRKMGADIVQENRTAVVRGVEKLRGAVVEATDLRAGAALVIAGLGAEGETIVEEIHHIDRGYENLVEKLQALGAQIARLSQEPLAVSVEEVPVCSV